MLVDGPPQPMLLATDADDHFVEMPFVSRCGQMPADLVGEILAKLQRPLPHCLMADQDASGREHLLDHAEAERETEVQPNSMADHFSREAVANVTRMTGRLHPSHMPWSGHSLVNLTMPQYECRNDFPGRIEILSATEQGETATSEPVAATGLKPVEHPDDFTQEPEAETEQFLVYHEPQEVSRRGGLIAALFVRQR